jgi:N-glycosylase/DNA lyase
MSVQDIVQCLVSMDEKANLDSLPEVQAMRRIIEARPNIHRDSVSRLCVAAALNDYQEAVSANPGQGSYWGRFVPWVIANGTGPPPWRRFPNVKAGRFQRFQNSSLWKFTLLNLDSGTLRTHLAKAMQQVPKSKTICFAPLVLARWAYVIGEPFLVVSDHPLPIDSRIAGLLQKIPKLNAHEAIQTANESRKMLERKELNMSDFDAWAWQNASRFV